LPPNTVDIPAGTAVPGCEVDDWCYMPSKLTISVGTTVTWINSDTLPHTVTSGSENADMVGLDVPNGFDSGFMSIDDRFEHTFDVAGLYDYYCQLHPWMQGSVTVE
jgi:plastocyanin